MLSEMSQAQAVLRAEYTNQGRPIPELEFVMSAPALKTLKAEAHGSGVGLFVRPDGQRQVMGCVVREGDLKDGWICRPVDSTA